ncbi:FUSC family protein [Pseudomonas matsuisoli]|uniref:Integral membrane bound transporter domain-containing protein n=1 Tax=Pseudomonas matsuisoli TaxID=1515666 RepID=A0A917PSV6_9PSED|nr:FUSC family protein [Pseudomonas matsuisoli]GGJ89851.1 hypothetical protein GCM10009304_14280 [Pseudomonas matsuisoli]
MAYTPSHIVRRLGWQPATPAFGPALIATLGCALPLLLGLFSGHSGFIWAATGAFIAALAKPLQRLGMLHMCLLVGLGAVSAGIGFWSDRDPVASGLLFGLYGLVFAWLQRQGREAGKFGFCLAICLCLGHGQHGIGALHSGLAVGTLFVLGGCWVMFLGFGLRGIHGLRMWPDLPSLRVVSRVQRRHNRQLPRYRWVLFATVAAISTALAGLIATFFELPRDYWMTLATFAVLQLDPRFSARNALRAAIVALVVLLLVSVLGHSLQSPQHLVLVILALVYATRAFLARRYAAYILQVLVCFVLLAEALSRDWYFAMQRLENGVYGAAIALTMVLIADRLSQKWGERRDARILASTASSVAATSGEPGSSIPCETHASDDPNRVP